MTSRNLLICMACVLSIGFAQTAQVAAQGNGALQITRIQTDQFPIIRTYLNVADSNGTRLTGLNPDTLSVLENGKPVRNLQIMEEETGVLVALILDASGNMVRLPGIANASRLENAKRAIDDLLGIDVQSNRPWIGKADTDKDYVSVIVPRDERSVTMLRSWQNDYNEIHNFVYQYVPPSNIGNTPLFEMIFAAIASFARAPVNDGLPKSIIVFSDGIDKTSDVVLQDAVNRAIDANVKVYTVLSGDQVTGANNLTRLARLTGGSSYRFVSFEALHPLWDQVTGLRTQSVLTFRSQLNGAGQYPLSVSFHSPNGPVLSGERLFTVALEPPQVVVVNPAANQRVERRTDDPKVADSDIEPRTISIKIQVGWPDGYPREIARVDYILGGTEYPVSAPPFDRFDWDIRNLAIGAYSIRVRVIDELGAVGESQPIPLNILISKPPTPVPTPDPHPDPTQSLITYTSLAVALGALALAVIVYRRRPEVFGQVGSALTSAVRTITEPFFPDRQHGKAQIKGYLVVVQGTDAYPQPIPIRSENMRMGRDPNLSTVHFDDRTVSRLHATITEEKDGTFRVRDEGSTSGTYVNYEQIDMGGQLLQDGDLINLGKIQLRFQLSPVSRSSQTNSPTDSTQPYQVIHPTASATPSMTDPYGMQPTLSRLPELDDGTEPFGVGEAYRSTSPVTPEDTVNSFDDAADSTQPFEPKPL